jgi:hypothetical protein
MIRLAAVLSIAVTLHVHAQSPAALPPLPPDGFVTLAQVVNDFSTQPDAAAQKYNGQRILVYGRVGDLAQSGDSAGNPLEIFLQLPSTSTPDVKAVFTLADIPEWGQNATLQISEDGSQAVIFHRNQEGNVTKQHVFAVEGENLGVRGTFDRFEAGDVVLKDCEKVAPEKLAPILQRNGIPTD